MSRRNAGADAGAVDALPEEIVVGEAVGIVPGGHFIGYKIINTGFFQDLRQDPAVSEYVRQPGIVNGDAEGFSVIKLSVEALADQAILEGGRAVRMCEIEIEHLSGKEVQER